jgi:hypothetical protein
MTRSWLRAAAPYRLTEVPPAMASMNAPDQTEIWQPRRIGPRMSLSGVLPHAWEWLSIAHRLCIEAILR